MINDDERNDDDAINMMNLMIIMTILTLMPGQRKIMLHPFKLLG